HLVIPILEAFFSTHICASGMVATKSKSTGLRVSACGQRRYSARLPMRIIVLLILVISHVCAAGASVWCENFPEVIVENFISHWFVDKDTRNASSRSIYGVLSP